MSGLLANWAEEIPFQHQDTMSALFILEHFPFKHFLLRLLRFILNFKLIICHFKLINVNESLPLQLERTTFRLENITH